MVCNSCHKELADGAAVCPSCGAAQNKGYSFMITLILCWFFGVFGVHRFYTKNTGSGVVQLLTCGGLGIWALIDFVMILIGSYRDGEGRPIVRG